MTGIQYIDRQEVWARAAGGLLGETALAVDTESNSMFAYRERICLVQIAYSGGVIILDPLAVGDLSALGRLLACAGTVKTLHGASYDLACFYRGYGFRVENLFDTEVAARFLGLPQTNLASSLQSCLGVSIPKDSGLQRSDWSRRPLEAEALEYAAADVRDLLRLADGFRARLEKLGRLDWVSEECRRLTQGPGQPSAPAEPAFLRVKGAYRLGPRELAVLRELWSFREAEAQRRDLPPFKVLGGDALLALAQSSHPAQAFPAEIPGLSAGVWRRLGPGIAAAIERGRNGPEFHRPPDAGRRLQHTPESGTRLRGLKNWRDGRAAGLGINPSLLWPTRSLERMAMEPPEPGGQGPGGGDPDVRDWQRREFGPELDALCALELWRQGRAVTPPAPDD